MLLLHSKMKDRSRVSESNYTCMGTVSYKTTAGSSFATSLTSFSHFSLLLIDLTVLLLLTFAIAPC